MRRAAKVDRNQAEIVRALRQAGASVQPLHTIGQGCPDLLVGFQGKNLIFEVKDGIQPWSKQQLTNDEKYWHATWVGDVHIIRSVRDAIKVLQEIR